ncbi:MAG: DUF4912 domain-containing protein [Clostridia bacterium]|nr:DUF4912 domain-containing protein [Clostridia bacterium]
MPKKAKEKLEEISEITTTKKETKAPTRKKASAKTTSKSTATKKSPSTKKTTGSRKKTSSKKNASLAKAKSTSRKKAIATSMEYYDLPYRYSQTIVKILAQTPSILFVYWDISDSDRENLLKQYGENFFQNTKPYLVVTNEDIHYQFEVEINDYANSWYLHIADSDCKYKVELIRKSIQQESQNHVVYITSSNEMNVPNDHILFDHLGKTVFFQNVKTNVTIEKDISTMSFINRIGKIYNIYDFYQEIYHDELNGDELGIALSSSQFSSHS